MQIDLTAIGVIIAAVALIIAYLQLVRTPKLSQDKQVSSTKKESLLSNIKANNHITIGYFNCRPFIEMVAESNSEPSGYYAAIMKKIFNSYNINILWKQLSICNSIESVLNKDVDVIVSVFQTAKRAKFVDFCCLHHSVKIGGVCRKNLTGIKSLSDLTTNQDLKIVVGKNEIGHELIEVLNLPRRRLTIIENEDTEKIISFIEIGQADVAILDSRSVKNFFDNFYTKKGVTLKPIFQINPLLICLNGIMIPQDQHELSYWLENEMKKVRNEESIKQMEIDFLEEFQGIINRI
ncbi:transporter substrate-binding domain-containing protein [Spirosoma sp. BT702]|uniref:Transporter substrate-binding domain-containing protein n=1 Tax=Spirosoma profusum TaxID=2771354 RepID=A0A927GAB0_9BACT|nr:transporter substrate-binding domain-containing protein [Spirosoma profusum]MBD2705293.1 transporter substrate-binding domain-containing protein [Spirosoma profusum]